MRNLFITESETEYWRRLPPVSQTSLKPRESTTLLLKVTFTRDNHIMMALFKHIRDNEIIKTE